MPRPSQSTRTQTAHYIIADSRTIYTEQYYSCSLILRCVITTVSIHAIQVVVAIIIIIIKDNFLL